MSKRGNMNIIEALDDAALFKPHFKGGSWTAWRAFLKALFALPMDDAELATYRECTGRTAPPDAAFKESTLIIGRRGGKSRNLALIAVFLATFRDYREYLAPGEVATVAVIAADRKQARSIFRFADGLIRAVPMLAALVETRTDEAILLSNRVAIEIHTASFRVTRGYTFAAVLADESAFWRSDDISANPDEEIFKALRPGLATIPNSIFLSASSPYRKRGVLYAAYQRYFGKDSGRVLVWKAPTLVMNPGLDKAIVEEAYADDPESASAEYGADFRSDLSDFVPRAIVDACTVRGRYELMRQFSTRYVAFCDPSGGSSDSMTMAIAHKAGEIVVLDAIREARPPFSPEAVVHDFAQTLKSYGLSTVHGDRYAGEWPRERFEVHGIKYNLSDRPKSDIYRDSLPFLNSCKVELLDQPRLANQLCALERRTSRGGRDSIDHPPGAAHDDVANSAMGALLLASEKGLQPARSIRFNLHGSGGICSF